MSDEISNEQAGEIPYILESLSDRDRLYLQFDLFRGEYYRELYRALDVGGLTRDPATAGWRLLDVCCGEGLYSADLVSQLPQVRVVGFDKDVNAIETAQTAYGDLGMKFYVQDAHDPIADADAYERPDGTHGEGFDVALMWFAAAHCNDPQRAFSNVFRALKPGGILLILDPTYRAYEFDHPSMKVLASAFMQIWKAFGNYDAGNKHLDLLPKVGFTVHHTQAHQYPMDIVNKQHQRMLTLINSTLASARKGIVDGAHLLSGEEFDRHLANLRTTCTPKMSGFAEVVITIARKPPLATAK